LIGFAVFAGFLASGLAPIGAASLAMTMAAVAACGSMWVGRIRWFNRHHPVAA